MLSLGRERRDEMSKFTPVTMKSPDALTSRQANKAITVDTNIIAFPAQKRNTYYKTCPLCKANLDPGEKCDCTTL